MAQQIKAPVVNPDNLLRPMTLEGGSDTHTHTPRYYATNQNISFNWSPKGFHKMINTRWLWSPLITKNHIAVSPSTTGLHTRIRTLTYTLTCTHNRWKWCCWWRQVRWTQFASHVRKSICVCALFEWKSFRILQGRGRCAHTQFKGKGHIWRSTENVWVLALRLYHAHQSNWPMSFQRTCLPPLWVLPPLGLLQAGTPVSSFLCGFWESEILGDKFFPTEPST